MSSRLPARALGLTALAVSVLTHHQSHGAPPAEQPSSPSAEGQVPVTGAIPPAFFSMTIGFGNLRQWPDVPFGMLGEIQGHGWSSIARARGSYNWKGLDRAVEMARSHGVSEVNFNMHLTPVWASSNPTRPCRDGVNLVGCADPPTNISDWDDFVTALVTQYKGRIQYYEIWDEPNRPETWRGSVRDMLALAQHAYPIIKSIDPNAKVLTPGVTVIGVGPSHPGCTLDCWLDRYLAAGGSKYTDGITWHGFYCRNGMRGCENGIGCDVALDCAGTPLLNQIKLVRSLQDKYGLTDKPILDTSGGWGRNENLTDPDQQAAYVARWYVLQAAEGVLAADWWSWNGKDWGTLSTPETGDTPAAEAYRHTYQWLVGSTMTKPCSVTSSLWSCEMTRPGGYHGLIVWAASGSAANYNAPGSYRQYRDLAGKTSPITGPIGVGYKPILLENRPVG